MFWIPTMLLVEDDLLISRRLRDAFQSPPTAWSDENGVGPFKVTLATTGAEARACLAEAASSNRPYDILVLDIGLPPRSGTPEDVAEGIGILKLVNERNCAAVVAESKFHEVVTLVQVLRCGPNDFLPKPFAEEEMFRAVARVHKGSLERRWNQLWKAHDQQWRLVQARAHVADRLSGIISEGIAQVLDHLGVVSELIKDRYQLDIELDHDDTLLSSLRELRQVAINVSRLCGDERMKVDSSAGELADVRSEEVVRSAAEKLRVGFLHRGLDFVPPNEGAHVVDTILEGVTTVIEEILFGAIEAAPRTSSVRSAVTSNEEAATLDISISDQGDSIGHLASRIAQGELLSPADGPRWGLSLAQRVAQYVVGGRIKVRSDDSGNVVTLQIPM